MSFSPFVPSPTLTLLPRGNLLLQSQTFDNASWTKTASMAVTANSTQDPYGLTTADTITRSATTAQTISQAVAKASAAQVYTLSLYAKAGTGSFIALGLQGASSANRADVCFNVSTGAISTPASVAGGFSGASATISGPTNGLYLLTLTATSDASASIKALISTSTVTQAVDGTGSGASSTGFIWGAQLEPYAQASGYAATVAAADAGIWAGVNALNVMPRLPGQSAVYHKAPLWSAKVARATSGRERRTAYWPYPLWQFEIALNVLRQAASPAELTKLWEFFNLAAGQFGPWLFVDLADCQLTSTAAGQLMNTATGGFTGDGATTLFQFTRPLNSFVEPVYGVYQPVVLDNGAPTAATLTFNANGTVSFSVAPANGHALTWFGYYYFLCRFSQDDLTADQIVSQLYGAQSLKFTSIRP